MPSMNLLLNTNGLDVTRNYKKVLEWFERVVTQGNANAQNNLGAVQQWALCNAGLLVRESCRVAFMKRQQYRGVQKHSMVLVLCATMGRLWRKTS
jgi:TPR repeat protein